MRVRADRVVACTLTTLLLVMLAAVAAQPALAQGRAISMPGLSGGQLSEGDLESGTWIVLVWASWSPRGRDIVDRANAIEGTWGNKANVVTVNFQESRPDIEKFLSGKGLKAPVYLDSNGAFSKKNAVTTLPGLLIFKGGTVVHRGRLPDDVDALIGRFLG